MGRKNPEEKRAYQREWYRNNSVKVKGEVRERRRALAKQLRDYKATLSCALCPEDSACCLDFHHVNDDKEIAVGAMVCDGYSWSKILKEINKCMVVCSNCHRKIHAGVVVTATH